MRGEWACQHQGVEMLALMKKTPQQQGAPKLHFLLTTAKETFNYQHYTGKKKKMTIPTEGHVFCTQSTDD